MDPLPPLDSDIIYGCSPKMDASIYVDLVKFLHEPKICFEGQASFKNYLIHHLVGDNFKKEGKEELQILEFCKVLFLHISLKIKGLIEII